MKTTLISFLFLVTLARADMWLIVDTRTTNAIPAKGEARMVDVADQGDHWQAYRKSGGDVPMQIPAWFDTEAGTYSFATNATEADADFNTGGSPERKALRQYLGKKPSLKNIRSAQRTLRRAMSTGTTFAIRSRAERNYVHFLELVEAFEESKEP